MSGCDGESTSNGGESRDDFSDSAITHVKLEQHIREALVNLFAKDDGKLLLKKSSGVEQAVDLITNAVAVRLKDTLGFQVDMLKNYERDIKQMNVRQNAVEFKVARKMDSLEQHGRLANIRVYGIKETAAEKSPDDTSDESDEDKDRRSEITTKLVANELNSKLNLQLKPHDISISHRVGKKYKPGEKVERYNPKTKKKELRDPGPRAIIVAFANRSMRNRVLRRRRHLKDTGISVSPDLTAPRAALLHDMQDKHGFRNAWADFNGNIYYKNGRDRVEAKPRVFKEFDWQFAENEDEDA
jgi:hypothetical protein